MYKNIIHLRAFAPNRDEPQVYAPGPVGKFHGTRNLQGNAEFRPRALFRPYTDPVKRTDNFGPRNLYTPVSCFGCRHVKDLLDVLESDLPQVPPDRFDRLPDQTAAHGAVLKIRDPQHAAGR